MSKSLKNKLSCGSCCSSKSLYNFEPGSTTNTSTNQSLESFLNDITPTAADIIGGGTTGGGTVTIPDPLVINDLTVNNLAQITDLTISGSMTNGTISILNNNINSSSSINFNAPNGFNFNNPVTAVDLNNNIGANSLIFTQSIGPQVNTLIPTTSAIQVTEPVGPGGVLFYDNTVIKGVTSVPLINDVLQYDGLTVTWGPSPGVSNVSLEQAYTNGLVTGTLGTIKLDSTIGPILIKESDTSPINNILFEITGPNPLVNTPGNNYFSVSDLNVTPDVVMGSSLQDINFTVIGQSLLGGSGNALTVTNGGGVLGGVNNTINSSGVGSFILGGVTNNITMSGQGTTLIGVNGTVNASGQGSVGICSNGTLGSVGSSNLVLVGGSNTSLLGSDSVCIGPSNLSCVLDPTVGKLFLKDNPITVRENTTFGFPTTITANALSGGFIRLSASGVYTFDSTINIRNELLDLSGAIFSANFVPSFTVIILNASLGSVNINLGAGQTLTNGVPPIQIFTDESKTLTFWFSSNNTIRIEDMSLSSTIEPFFTTNKRAIISGNNNNVGVASLSYGGTLGGLSNTNTISANTGGIIIGGQGRTTSIGGAGNVSISGNGVVGSVVGNSNLVLIGGANTTLGNSNSVCVGSSTVAVTLQPNTGKLFLKDNPVAIKENTIYNAIGVISAVDINKGFIQLNAGGVYTLDSTINIRNILLDASGGVLGATVRPVFSLVLYNSSASLVSINIGAGQTLTNGSSPIGIQPGQSKTWNLWFTSSTTMLIEDLTQASLNEPLFTTNRRAIIAGLSNNVLSVSSNSYGGIFGGNNNSPTIGANTGSIMLGGSSKTASILATGSVNIGGSGIIGSGVLNNNLILIGGSNTNIYGTGSIAIGPSSLTNVFQPIVSKLFIRDNPVFIKENTNFVAVGLIDSVSIAKGYVQLSAAGAYNIDSTVAIRNTLLDASATPFVGNVRAEFELILYNSSGSSITVSLGAGQTFVNGTSPVTLTNGESRTWKFWFTSITTMLVQDSVLSSIIASSVTLTNAGGTISLVNDGVGPTLATKGLTAGSGINLFDGGTFVSITNSSPASSVSLSNAGGTSLVNTGIGPALATKGLIAGPGIGLVSAGTTVTINNLSTFGSDYLNFVGDFASQAGGGIGVWVSTIFNQPLAYSNWVFNTAPNYTDFSNVNTGTFVVTYAVQAVIPGTSCFTIACYNTNTGSYLPGSQRSYRNSTGTTYDCIPVEITFPIMVGFGYTAGDILQFRFQCSAVGSSLVKTPAGAPATAANNYASLIIRRMA